MLINTLFPLELVVTRYFETMASKSLEFCEKSPLYEHLFKEGEQYVSFEPNLIDFEEKLFFYLSNEEEWGKVT